MLICLLQRELSSIRFSKYLPAVVRSSRIRRDWYRNTVTFVELTYHDLIDTWKRDIEQRFKILLEILWLTLYLFYNHRIFFFYRINLIFQSIFILNFNMATFQIFNLIILQSI